MTHFIHLHVTKAWVHYMVNNRMEDLKRELHPYVCTHPQLSSDWALIGFHATYEDHYKLVFAGFDWCPLDQLVGFGEFIRKTGTKGLVN